MASLPTPYRLSTLSTRYPTDPLSTHPIAPYAPPLKKLLKPMTLSGRTEKQEHRPTTSRLSEKGLKRITSVDSTVLLHLPAPPVIPLNTLAAKSPVRLPLNNLPQPLGNNLPNLLTLTPYIIVLRVLTIAKLLLSAVKRSVTNGEQS